jgi:hypothetical protein
LVQAVPVVLVEQELAAQEEHLLQRKAHLQHHFQ